MNVYISYFVGYKRRLEKGAADSFILWLFARRFNVSIAVMLNGNQQNDRGIQWWTTHQGSENKPFLWKEAMLILVHNGDWDFTELTKVNPASKAPSKPPASVSATVAVATTSSASSSTSAAVPSQAMKPPRVSTIIDTSKPTQKALKMQVVQVTREPTDKGEYKTKSPERRRPKIIYTTPKLKVKTKSRRDTSRQSRQSRPVKAKVLPSRFTQKPLVTAPKRKVQGSPSSPRRSKSKSPTPGPSRESHETPKKGGAKRPRPGKSSSTGPAPKKVKKSVKKSSAGPSKDASKRPKSKKNSLTPKVMAPPETDTRKLRVTKLKENQCNVCGVQLSDRSNLNKHYKRFHVAKRAHSCPQCPKSFVTPSDYHSHLKTHLPREKRPYFVCRRCRAKLLTQHALDRHKELHGNRQHQCPHCPRVFKTKHLLQDHINRHKGYRCQVRYCKYFTHSRDAFQVHLRKEKRIAEQKKKNAKN